MKLLTFNVGLLDYKIWGLTMFSNPPYSEQRIKHIPGEILKINADIVVLQECYYEYHAKYLFEAMKHVYPYMSRKNGLNWYTMLNLQNGLVILSKYEITDTKLVSHKQVAAIEYWFADKSTLIAHVNVPELGKFSIINTHPTAGGSEPESGKADMGREYALRQTLEAADASRKDGYIPIVIGDFNCAPDCSALNYEFIVNYGAGYRDCFAEMTEKKLLNGEDCSKTDCTWDPLNVLNASGPHNHCPPCRVDHVFLPKNEAKFGTVISCDIVFTEKIVEIKGKKETFMCSLSDHYGIMAEIDIVK